MRNAELAITPFAEALQKMIQTVDQLEITWEFLDLSKIRQAIDGTLSSLDKSARPAL